MVVPDGTQPNGLSVVGLTTVMPSGMDGVTQAPPM
jgi:hypothetical protein